MSERDPEGKDPHAGGAKLDDGKNRVGGFMRDFPRALLRVSEVWTAGANKYTSSGWETVPDKATRYTDAKCRHLLKGFIEENDPDSEMEHLAHEVWNGLLLLETLLREKDDG
jgi:hypothetical protein